MAPKLPPKPIREQARVLYPYTAQNDDELTIKEGDIITITSKENEDAGWWKGELNGRIALFPDNFVEIIKQPSGTPTITPTTPNNNATATTATITVPATNQQPSNTTTTTLQQHHRGGGTTTDTNHNNSVNNHNNNNNNNNETTTTATIISNSIKLNRVKKPDRIGGSITVNSHSSSIDPSVSITSAKISKDINRPTQQNKSLFSITGNLMGAGATTTESTDENKPKTSDETNIDDNCVTTTESNRILDRSPFITNMDNVNGATPNSHSSNGASDSPLEHLTKERPKIPSSSRRPPSLYFPKQSNDSNHMDGNGGDVISDSLANKNQQDGADDDNHPEQRVRNSVLFGRSSSINQNSSNSGGTSTPPEKNLPWMRELMKAQDLKRERSKENQTLANNNSNEPEKDRTIGGGKIAENSNFMNIHKAFSGKQQQQQSSTVSSTITTTTTTIVTTATSSNLKNNPPITTNKPFVLKSNKPSLSQSFSDRDSGGNGTTAGTTSFSSATIMVDNNNHSTTTATAASTTATTTTTNMVSGLAKIINPASRKQQPPSSSTSTTTTAAAATNNKNTASDQFRPIVATAITNSGATTTINHSTDNHHHHHSNNLKNNNNSTPFKQQEIAELRLEVQELRNKLTDLDTKLSTILKQQNSKIDKLQITVKELLDNELKTKMTVKEVINEWIEERMAQTQIELERLKKLNTTV